MSDRWDAVKCRESGNAKCICHQEEIKKQKTTCHQRKPSARADLYGRRRPQNVNDGVGDVSRLDALHRVVDRFGRRCISVEGHVQELSLDVAGADGLIDA